jgi:hypothetical protein
MPKWRGCSRLFPAVPGCSRQSGQSVLEDVLDSGCLSERVRTVRQDLSFVVSILLLLGVAGAALTGLAVDEDEFFGMGEDLHAFAGWSVVVLAALHVLLRAGCMIRYAKRRLRRFVGVGAVVRSGADDTPGVE